MGFWLPFMAGSEPLATYEGLIGFAGPVSILSRPCARAGRAAARWKADMHTSVRRSATALGLAGHGMALFNSE
jgi:hypothetical protein